MDVTGNHLKLRRQTAKIYKREQQSNNYHVKENLTCTWKGLNEEIQKCEGQLVELTGRCE